MPKPGDIISLSATVAESVHLQGGNYNLRLVSEEGTTVWIPSADVLAAGGSITETEPIPIESTPEAAPETTPEEPEPPAETEPTGVNSAVSATGGF